MAYLRQGKTGSRKYPFGKATPMLVRRRLGAPLLAELPLEPTVSTEGLMRVMASENGISRALSGLAALMAT